MRFFLASFHIFLLSGAYPEASFVGVCYCVSVHCFPESLSTWAVFLEKLWLFNVTAVSWRCASSFLQPVERSSSRSSGDHPDKITACIH